MVRLRRNLGLLRWLMIGFGIDLSVFGSVEIALSAAGSYPNVLVIQRQNDKYLYYNPYQSHVGPAFVSLLAGIALVGAGRNFSPSMGRAALGMEREIENRSILFKTPSLWTALGNFIVMFIVYGFGNPPLFSIWYVHHIFEVAGFCFLGCWWGSVSSAIHLQEKVSSTIVWLICVVAAISTIMLLGFSTCILIPILLITPPFPVGYYISRLIYLKSRKVKTEMLE